MFISYLILGICYRLKQTIMWPKTVNHDNFYREQFIQEMNKIRKIDNFNQAIYSHNAAQSAQK